MELTPGELATIFRHIDIQKALIESQERLLSLKQKITQELKQKQKDGEQK